MKKHRQPALAEPQSLPTRSLSLDFTWACAFGSEPISMNAHVKQSTNLKRMLVAHHASASYGSRGDACGFGEDTTMAQNTTEWGGAVDAQHWISQQFVDPHLQVL